MATVSKELFIEIINGLFFIFPNCFKNVSGTISSTMEMKTERIGHFMIIAHRDIRGRVIKTVFLNHVSVAHFHADDACERKLAAIELVERGLCTNKVAGKICGLHRNTVFKLLRAKRLLGLEAVLKDDRGLEEPYKYVNEVRSHIKQIFRKCPDWTDQAVAEQAAKDLGMSISQSTVARIRNEWKGRQGPALPTKSEIMEMSRMAEVSNAARTLLTSSSIWGTSSSRATSTVIPVP
jgi:transposase